jgi:glycosyltransferase involved in cell wall biosynthesis
MISVTILTKNSARTLASTLDSLKSFAEVIILDTGSSDNTLEIAKKYPNCKIHQTNLLGFGEAHNEASAFATFDWVLSIDSDEVLSSELIEEIHQLNLDPTKIYVLQRQNYFNGRHIKCCGGWYPDPVPRLYNRKRTSFSNDAVSEKILAKGFTLCTLHSPLVHTPYLEMSDFLSKMQLYSALFAKQHQHKKKASVPSAILHGFFAFFKSYFLKKGFLGGKEGFIISAYNGHATFYKYLKLWEANRK